MLSRTILRLATICLAFQHGVIAMAQEETPTPVPSSSPNKRTVRISFLPPPLEGSISLGVYDPKGKLIRVLYREADVDEFNVGSDALTTTWDGKDDSGKDVDPGKYSAHGFVVGDLGIKGLGFFFNDFVANVDSPRVRHLKGVRRKENELHLDAELAGDQEATLICDMKQGALLRTIPLEERTHCDMQQSLPEPARTIDCDQGVNETIWLIENSDDGARREIKQLSKTHELLRHLPIADNGPQPQAIAASVVDDQIFVVEETLTPSLNRLRALRPPEAKTDSPEAGDKDWKSDFEKQIVEHRNFSIENGKPVPNNPKNKILPEKISVKLQPNPLLADARVTVELGAGFDGDGGFLKTADGLPLSTVSETARLVRALLIAHGSNAVDVFLDDGAVVEQIRITGLDQMMSFDCGNFELK